MDALPQPRILKTRSPSRDCRFAGKAMRRQSSRPHPSPRRGLSSTILAADISGMQIIEDAAKIAIEAFDIVRVATVPQNIDTAIAVGLAEAVAGAFGAVLSRGVANVVGDIKVDSFRTKITSTSAYFGTRSVIRTVLRLLGFPRPIALILASVAGSYASESTKASGRMQGMDGAATDNQKLKTFGNMISLSELSGDVTKWVLFDLVSELLPASYVGVEKNLAYFALGGVSAVGGNVVKELPLEAYGEDSAVRKINKKPPLVSYSQAFVEGGVLFLTYGVFLYATMTLVPSDFNRAFFFSSILEEGEKDVQSILN